MKTVCSDKNKKHFPKGELSGGELVRPFECPERWDYIIQSLQNRGYREHLEPAALDFQLVE